MMAVNLSRRQFQDPELGTRIERILRMTGIPPQQIQFEISENVAIDNPEQVAETLEALTAMGLNIALDDFGTGHSSLTLLRRFQTCCLKIDRSFISDLPDDADACAITSAVITLATSLGLEVVAEGVETEAQRAYLIDQGCSHAQGYLFAGALDADGVEEFLCRHRAD
jgi:EAL domain-containing protein (putative c-di-GMP-specific phosphodiesterase class I)